MSCKCCKCFHFSWWCISGQQHSIAHVLLFRLARTLQPPCGVLFLFLWPALSRLSMLFHSCFLPSCPLSLSCLTVYYQCYFLLVVYVSQWYYNCFTINTCLVPCLRRVYSFEPRVAKLAALLPIIYNCHFNLSQKEYKAKLCINFPSKLWVSYV